MTITNNGYVQLHKPNHANASVNGLIYEHVYIASKMLGRPLLEGETVHHVDEHKLNNDPDNLWIFASRADHARYHLTGYVMFIGGIAYSPKIMHFCRVCGVNIKKRKSGLCHKHAPKIMQKVKRPDREELKNLIRCTPFLTLGKKYGVSDNSIRKWCISYNLPYRSAEIKAYSDSEWERV